MLIAALYVQSMHILNHLMGRQSDRFNDPDRSEFYIRYRLLLSILAIAAGGAGLLTAYRMGWMPFLILLVMSILGFSYNLKLIPDWFPMQPKYKRIKDIPGSKTILIAVAWGIVSAIFPSFEKMGGLDLSMIVDVFLGNAFCVRENGVFRCSGHAGGQNCRQGNASHSHGRKTNPAGFEAVASDFNGNPCSGERYRYLQPSGFCSGHMPGPDAVCYCWPTKKS